MISVIICSVNPVLLNQLSKNIEDTIGTQYEIVAIDNRGTGKGICQVYNEGAAKAKYDLLCFIHEDIIIETPNWGTKLAALFKEDPALGVVGVAGAGYMPLSPSTWGGIGRDSSYINIIQHYKYKKKKEKHFYRNPDNERLSYVASLDGVWLSTTKKVTTEFKFDEATFKGFHGYDIDFSLSAGTKYKIAVTFEVLIKHFSEGRYDRKWMVENLKVFYKWGDSLPINIAGLPPEEVFIIEKSTFKHFVNQLITYKLPLSIAFKFLWKKNRFFLMDKRLLPKLNFYILKQKLIPGKVNIDL